MVPLGASGSDGAALYGARLCGACHGERGARPALAIYPRLTGQSAAYLLAQMQDIRDGRRSNGMSAAMRATLSGVGDDELKANADWLSGL